MSLLGPKTLKWPPTDLPLFLSLRWSASRTVLIDRLFVTLPGVT